MENVPTSHADEKQFSQEEYLRIGRTLRRISRTSRQLMSDLGIKDEEVKIPRLKRRKNRGKQ